MAREQPSRHRPEAVREQFLTTSVTIPCPREDGNLAAKQSTDYKLLDLFVLSSCFPFGFPGMA